jgi:hypothetical protein
MLGDESSIAGSRTMQAGPMIGRLVLLLAIGLALGGCNLVVSTTPVFTDADAAGHPPLRAGVWASPDDGCAFKPDTPFDSWPGCANGALITADAILGPAQTPSTPDASDSGAPPKAAPPTAVPYILAAGDPRVLQVHFAPSPTPGFPTMAYFWFIAVHPTALDHDGRITAAQIWPIQCGPPPPKKPIKGNADANDLATRHPLPGMTLNNGLCTPAGKAAVLNAAGPSRAWADKIGVLKWVRDGPN